MSTDTRTSRVVEPLFQLWSHVYDARVFQRFYGGIHDQILRHVASRSKSQPGMKFFERSQITAAWSAATARSIDAPRPHVTSYVTALAKEFANGTVTYARDKRAAKAKMVGAIAALIVLLVCVVGMVLIGFVDRITISLCIALPIVSAATVIPRIERRLDRKVFPWLEEIT